MRSNNKSLYFLQDFNGFRFRPTPDAQTTARKTPRQTARQQPTATQPDQSPARGPDQPPDRPTTCPTAQQPENTTARRPDCPTAQPPVPRFHHVIKIPLRATSRPWNEASMQRGNNKPGTEIVPRSIMRGETQLHSGRK